MLVDGQSTWHFAKQDILMRLRIAFVACGLTLLAFNLCGSIVAKQTDDDKAQIKALIDKGDFKAAEKRLQAEISDPSAPITSEPAIQLEVLRRTRSDYALTEKDLLAEIRKEIPDATQADVDRWRKAGDFQFRVIDGETRYFRRTAGNLFRVDEEAKKRQKEAKKDAKKDAAKKFNTTDFIKKLVKLSESSESPEVFPVKHVVYYTLTLHPDNPRVKPGAVVRAWLPFPQEYRQQKDVKLVRSDPPATKISSPSSPQRTVFFEQTITDASKPPRFDIVVEYHTSAYCPKLDPAKVQPYDMKSATYRQYTAERPPHILFTPEVKELAREIVGKETNPLEKARSIFRWISKNVTWVAEQEYSIIPSLSVKGLTARRGDCGVQGTSFITLCRAAGVPARWQSGWQLKPGELNMHDWAEIYIEPWGWLPADASWGMMKSDDPAVRDFFCGHIDPYRLIVNLDYSRTLDPPKQSFRSEPIDFQRGEVEIDGHNLYFDEWDYKFDVKTTPSMGK
jgi:transglutaminase-like putative cysteine protease